MNLKARVQKHVKGIKLYYNRDGLAGVWYYINHRIYNRIIAPLLFSDLWIPFSAERRIARNYEKTLPRINNQHFLTMGNYCIHDDPKLNRDSIVYSLGVLADTDFDQAISDRYDCPIYLFDPSNIAKNHLDKVNNPKFIFEQVGVWNETLVMQFTSPKYGGSPSMVPTEYKGKRFEHKCVDIKEILEKNGHDHIDVIKMDIEGAAFEVIERLLEIEVYPRQLVAEFERMKTNSVMDFLAFYSRLIKLNQRMVELGYKIHVIPREKFKYFSIELIYVRS